MGIPIKIIKQPVYIYIENLNMLICSTVFLCVQSFPDLDEGNMYKPPVFQCFKFHDFL